MDGDHIYYNLMVAGGVNGDNYKEAAVNTSLPQSILSHAGDYYLNVVRFSVSGWNIPLFAPVTGRTYSIGVGGALVDVVFGTYYSMQAFVSAINVALTMACTTAGIGEGWLQYDAPSQGVGTLAFVVPATWIGAAVIEVNTALKDILPGFEWEGSPGTGWSLVPYDQHVNWYTPPSEPVTDPPGWLYFVQDCPGAGALCPIKTIQLLSQTIPLVNEFAGVTSTPIVKDYVPILQNGLEARIGIDYVPDGTPQLIDLHGGYPIRSIDLRAMWAGEDGIGHPITLPYGGVFSCKLEFIRKATLSSLYS